MAIARGVSINGGRGVPPYTSSSSIVVASSRVLVAGLRTSFAAGDVISGVTWDGGSQAMTLATKVDPDTFGTYTYIFFLANPTAATGTLTVSGTDSGSTYIVAATYSGVATSGQPTNTATAASTTSPASGTINVPDANSWVVAFAYCDTSLAASTGLNTFQFGDFSNCGIMDSNAAVGTGNYSMAITGSPLGGLGFVSMTLAPPGSASRPVKMAGEWNGYAGTSGGFAG